jgi:hypothetical protein
VETSAGEPLISRRPFAVTKCSAWLVSNESPVSQAPSPVILKSATISYRTPCRRLLTDSTQKTRGLQKPSIPNIMGSQNNRAGMSAYGQAGSATGGQ